jgi:hypothetical protein
MRRFVAGLTAAVAFSVAAGAAWAEKPAAASPKKTTPALEQVWRFEGLDAPESIALSADGTFLYVSNVAGEGDAKDGNGFVSRVSLDGRMLQPRWAEGLDAPKGLALKGDRLFAADIDQIVELDAASGRVVARHAAPGAKFLNYAAVAPDGTVLVSDSGAKRIYALGGQGAAVWLEHPLLEDINGLLPEPERLVVTTMKGRLLVVDWRSKQIEELASGLGNADGAVRLAGGDYVVGEWPGRLFRVKADGSHEVLLDTREAETYQNDFLVVGDLLIVPNWKPGSLTAWRAPR